MKVLGVWEMLPVRDVYFFLPLLLLLTST